MRTGIAAIGVILLMISIGNIRDDEKTRDYKLYRKVIQTIQTECSAPNV